MPPVYKINDQLVSPQTFQGFKQELESYAKTDPKVFEDQEVSSEEIRKFLDQMGNQDGHLQLFDLEFIAKRISAQKFTDLKTLLQKHHWNVYENAEDLEQQVGTLVASVDSEDGVDSKGYEKLIANRDLFLAAVRVDEEVFEFLSGVYEGSKGEAPGSEFIEKLRTILEDRNFILAAVQQNGWVLEYLPKPFKEDEEVILAAIQQTPFALLFVSPQHRYYPQFVLEAVKKDADILDFIDEKSWLSDRKIVLEAAQQGYILTSDSPFFSDREIVLVVVKEHGLMLEFVNAKLRDDREVVLAAVRKNGLALKFANPKLQADREIVLAAIEAISFFPSYKSPLAYAATELRSDRSLALAAVKKFGIAFKYLPPHLQNDREFVLAAVQQNGQALLYAPAAFQKDREIFLAATKAEGRTALVVEGDLSPFPNDRETLSLLISKFGVGLKYANEEIRSDRELVLQAVQRDGLNLQHASTFQNDRALVLAAVQDDGLALQYASPTLRKDWEVVSTACHQNFLAFQHADPDLQRDRSFTLSLVSRGVNLSYSWEKAPFGSKEPPPPKITFDFDEDLLLKAFQQNPDFFIFMPHRYKFNPKWVLEAVRRKGELLAFVPSALRGNTDVVSEAVRQDGKALFYASESLQKEEGLLKEALKTRGVREIFSPLHPFYRDKRILLMERRIREREGRLASLSAKITEADLRPDGSLEVTVESTHTTAFLYKITPLSNPNNQVVEGEEDMQDYEEGRTLKEDLWFDLAETPLWRPHIPYQFWVKTRDSFWQAIGNPFEINFAERVSPAAKPQQPPPSKRPLPPDPGEIR